jgi:hypothetical protein
MTTSPKMTSPISSAKRQITTVEAVKRIVSFKPVNDTDQGDTQG